MTAQTGLERPTAPRKPYLVVARVGDGSLHPTWTQGERTFDLVVDYYGDTPGRWDGTAEHVVENKGSKWVGLHTLLTREPGLLDGYEAVWFPDDDLATDAATISEMFALHTHLGLGLSQPSLTTDSYFTHLMTLTHPGFSVRWTTFVEVMAPLFSRAALDACLPTFAESRSGYGLDLVWQGILPGLGLESAVMDCLAVRHTRPLGSGSLYDGMTEPPHREGARVARAHGMPTPHEFLTLRALLADGRELDGPEAERTALAAPPVPTVQPVPAWDLYLDELRTRTAGAPAAAEPTLARAPRPAADDDRPTALDDLDEDRPLVLVVGAPAQPAAGVPAPAANPGGTTPGGPTTLGGVTRLGGGTTLGGAGRAARPGLLPSSSRAAATGTAADAWLAAGWQVVDLPAGDDAGLVRHLRAAERFRDRVLDVTAPTSRALVRAVEAAAGLGCATVVRLTAETLACRHGLPAAVRAQLPRCEVCHVEWTAIAAAATQVVGTGPVATALAEVGVAVEVRGDVDRSALAAGAQGPAPAGGTTVVVFARNDRAEVNRLVEALTHQRGLTTPPEVLVVPAARQTATPRGPVDRTRMDVHVLDLPGPQGFAQALAAATRERVLVLDAADVPGPWCLHDHEVAAAGSGGVVRSDARPDPAADDAFTAALQRAGTTDVPSPGARASVATGILQQVAAVHAMASATTAAAVLSCGRVRHVARPTHTAPAFTDLEAVRGGAVLASLAAAATGPLAPAALARLTPELTFWSHRGGENLRLAAQMLEHPGDVLRQAVVNAVTGHRATDALDEVIAGEVAAHWASAQLATDRVRRAVAERGSFTLGVPVRDGRLLPLLSWLTTSGAVDQSLVQVRIGLEAADGDPSQFTGMLAEQLQRSGVDLDLLPLVDVVGGDGGPVHRALDVDVVLRSGDERWYPGLPVPLLALDAEAWLSFLGVVALVASLSSPAAAREPSLA
ncbi:hypothetical protein GTR02_06480 [Kineococcus sp. R8]|uniref:hypothetical protein n=1 Tax=Kineococcus siccus TaxID=2696567 RepID=UPI001412E366|nr:hypothetical protein [Kineococcus siccus]NAZ81460.1 hypothetical protein [Kineococcus siccus]